ncbi:MAG: DNA-binding protein WhiA [Firmicutes bacterium]|nr:DNA-binding protein WhiA [Bacillota bacterium]
MDFSARVRDELARLVPRRRCCLRAELSALLALDGTETGDGPVVSATSAAVARKLFKLAKAIAGEPPRVSRAGRGRRGRFLVHLGPAAPPVQPGLPKRECCRRSYLRGVFLSRGSISDPESGYHLEILLDRPDQAATVGHLLGELGVRFGIMQRKGSPVIYVKGADDIAEVLRLTGAHGALLELENFRVLKDMRNHINRQVNAEAANVEKAVAAAVRQLEDIRLIDRVLGLSNLSPSLEQVARLRLAHPDLSLKDLGQQASPPLGKSAVNHRFRRLARLAEDLRRNRPPNGGN